MNDHSILWEGHHFKKAIFENFTETVSSKREKGKKRVEEEEEEILVLIFSRKSIGSFERMDFDGFFLFFSSVFSHFF